MTIPEPVCSFPLFVMKCYSYPGTISMKFPFSSTGICLRMKLRSLRRRSNEPEEMDRLDSDPDALKSLFASAIIGFDFVSAD